jgi:hypothetical protein
MGWTQPIETTNEFARIKFREATATLRTALGLTGSRRSRRVRDG